MNAVSILRGYADNRLGRYTPSEIHVFREAADQIESQAADVASYQQVKKTLSDEGFEDLGTMIAEYKQVLIEANEHAIEADDDREKLEAQLAASQRRERAAVEYCKSPHYGDGDYYCGADSACQEVLDILCGSREAGKGEAE
ncbi:MAG: hypothetical protein EOM66_03100 [Clostridia bacterium]|nr:hypothetical protein [Clostridia bacterium]